MKTKLITILGLLLMFSLVVAVGLGVSKDVPIDTIYKEKIEAINNEDIEWVALKDDKIIEELTKQQTKKLETIAKGIIKREAEVEKKVINDAGRIILSVG